MGKRGNTGISQEKERLYRINEIWQLKIDNPLWNRERLVAEYQYRSGASRRTVLDYLKVLENSEKIVWETKE